MAQGVAGINGNDSSKLNQSYFDDYLKRNVFGYDEYMIDVLDFEFMSVDCMYFEDKENRYETSFLLRGIRIQRKPGSVFEREPRKMHISTVYGGSYIIGTDFMSTMG